jgi:cytochrome bd-type quinol oxidase subunit 2
MELATSSDAVDEQASSESMSLEATPWSRLWARMLDIQIESFLIAFVLGLVFPNLFAGDIFKGRSGSYLIGFLLLPFALLLDAAIQKVFGRTVGQAVVGIRVETAGQERLTFGLAVRRNAAIYIRGLILGIPLVNLIGLWKAYGELKAGRPTSWDRNLSTRVVAKRYNVVRTALAAALVVMLIIGGRVLDAVLPS